MPAYDADGELIGHLFSTYDVVRAPSCSPRPFDAIVDLDLNGHLTGAKMIGYHDPYRIGFPARFEALEEFLVRYAGYPVNTFRAQPVKADFVAGATISARTIRAGILDVGCVVSRATSDQPLITEPTLDRDGYIYVAWDQLLEMSGLVHREITYGEVRAAFAAAGAADAETHTPLGVPQNLLSTILFECRFVANGRCSERPVEPHPDDEIYIDYYFAFSSPPLIGRNALGSNYAKLDPQPEGSHLFTMFSTGPYNFRGLSYYRADTGYTFDRVKVLQGDLELIFTRDQHQLISLNRQALAEGSPYFPDVSNFAIPPDTGFDPLLLFEVVLMVSGTNASGEEVIVEFPVAYQVPQAVVLMPFVEPPPAWVESWQASVVDIGILGVMLLVVTLLFVFQGRLTKSRRAHAWIRNGFLLFTLVWLGWIAGAQLSIVHVINYITAPFDGVGIGFYLAEPLIVILGVYVIVSIILIGRGLFCGWLCPFGALQELAIKIGRIFRLPSWNPSERTQRWLWLPKYGIAAIVVGTAFSAPAALAAVEEVEPFKTRDHLDLHPALALRHLCWGAVVHGSFHRAFLLPVPVPARRRPGGIRPVAHIHAAEAPAGMRQSVPAVRAGLPGESNRRQRSDRDGRVLPVPGLHG